MRPTLKDIARICEVSPTVVSAALNNRKGSVSYSKALQKKVIEIAMAMNYRPNAIGRAMVSKKVPLVANMVHWELADNRINYYFYDVLTTITILLNNYGMETLFIPYSSEDDQLRRLQALMSSGFIGGVFSNIIPDEHRRFAKFLKDSGLPYVINGDSLEPDAHCVVAKPGALWDLLHGFATEKGIRRIFQVNMLHDVIGVKEYPFPRGNHYLAAPMRLEDATGGKGEKLFVAMGLKEAASLLESKLVRQEDIVLVEDARCATMPPDINALRINTSASNKEMLEYCALTLSTWMNDGVAPQELAHEFPLAGNNIEIVRLI